jgi:histone deacetylase complex regulatory component SIN3
VSKSFKGQPEIYDELLDLMKEFVAGCFDSHDVIQRVSKHLKGHRELFFTFKAFLPPGF